jgi:outer membrane protein assembly factor BamA
MKLKILVKTSIIALLVLLQIQIHAQQYRLVIEPADSATASKIKGLNYNRKPGGAQKAQKELGRVLNYFYSEGYLRASIDSLKEDSLKMTAWLYTGEVYKLSELRPGNTDELILSQSGYKEKYFKDRPFSPDEIRNLSQKILKYCENNGYPFAIVKLDSVSILRDQSISASLHLQLNQRVVIDTIIVKGDSKLHWRYIRSYLNMKEGDIYNEQKVRRIGGRISDLPFVDVIKEYEVVFMEDKARIILYLDKKRASQFDGILGVAPNEQSSGKLLITGDIKLKLLSAFNRGELIDLNWKKLESSSQDLKFNFNYPFLFSTPFGVDYKLQLFKKDTSYLNLRNHIGIQVLFSGYNSIKAFYESNTSNLLSTEGLESATVLPEYADITSNLYGLGANISKLNYRFNPRKGFYFDISGAIGTKKVKKNINVNQALYDSIALNSTLYRLELDGGLFIPLFRSTTLLFANKSGFLENKNLFDNELFRLGGLKTLRGFDEESIYASIYSIFTLEFRYLFDVNSFFQLFCDYAYYERNTNSVYSSDMPIGFGAGVSFETQAGIFSLSYALGSRKEQPIQFKSAKIHFGLTAKF